MAPKPAPATLGTWGPLKFIPNPIALGQSIGSAASVPGEFIAGMVRATAWISDYRNWVRIAYVTVGGTIVIVGVAGLVFGSHKVAATTTGYAKKGAGKVKAAASKPAPADGSTSKASKVKTAAKKTVKTAAKVAVVA